jgi:flagellar hook assembly protein FlgD
MPQDGILNVMIMTLDGNVIDYLSYGKTTAGSHHYTWDGKNKAGSPVARGMYFIRVIGTNFDETRKVMVVK